MALIESIESVISLSLPALFLFGNEELYEAPVLVRPTFPSIKRTLAAKKYVKRGNFSL